ncbi:MAG: hypothetical protein AB8B52_08495 [Winogradskyella sp.]|uniref:hypothetical protein n=1 Tax=Winogradskyella sp. TaxID=1883156 RepID=UPI00385C1E30
MKKQFFLVFILCLIFSSCNIDDDTNVILGTEILPIESVEMPESFVLNETYEIHITYNRPSNCYQFYDFYYEINQNERTVGIINTVYDNPSCIEEEESVTVTLNFRVVSTETYLFKFYQGQDEEGEDLYYLVEVPVVDG